ncbi:MAG: ABC transporter ATP-binding protein [Sumerlaeia bacterium]
MLGSFIAAAFAAISIVALVPIIQFVLSESAADGFAQTETVPEPQSAPALPPQARAVSDSLKEVAGERLAQVEDAQAWVDARQASLKERAYLFLKDNRDTAMFYIVGILILFTVLRAAMEYFAKLQITSVVYRGLHQIRLDLYTSVLALDLAAFQSRTTGNLIARMNSDVSQIRTIMQQSLSQSILVPFQIVGYLAALLYLSVQITLITIVALPFIILPIALLSRTLRRLSKADAEEDAYLVDVMQETFQGMPIVKAYGTEKHESSRFRDVSKGQLKRQIRRMRIRLAGGPIVEVMTTAAMGLVLLAGTYVVMKARLLGTAEFIAYLAALTRFYKPLKGLSNGWVKVQRGLASAERVFEVIDTEMRVVEKPDAKPLPTLEREIAFEEVAFTYNPDEPPVLKNLNLRIPKGKMIALVGVAGSGKTTLIRLVPRFFDPTGGRILFDGVDLRDATIKSIRDQIAIVTQETILFDETVAYNIGYGCPKATQEQIEAAARAANAHDFITALPEGYQTRIGERGNRLSGGQKQRLAIARAILRNAPILILDEATSALDNESERLVQDALDHLMEDRTSLVIAHRLSTVRHADEIVVLQNGEIIEQGSHDVLMAGEGRYSELYKIAFAPKANEQGENQQGEAEPTFAEQPAI